MKNIRILSVTFSEPIAEHEIPAFRGAIIEKVGLERDLFHNHNNQSDEDQQYHYRYPLVQYKRRRKKPTLVFIEHGIDEAQHFFTKPSWDMTMAGRTYHTSIEQMLVREYPLGITETEQHYTIRHWQALNQKNFSRYMELDGLPEKAQLLEKVLTAHLLALGSGVDHFFTERFDLIITRILGTRYRAFGGVKVKTFDVRFKVNMQIPPFLGVGKGVSKGFGTVSKYVPKKKPVVNRF